MKAGFVASHAREKSILLSVEVGGIRGGVVVTQISPVRYVRLQEMQAGKKSLTHIGQADVKPAMRRLVVTTPISMSTTSSRFLLAV
jgi:hypothetical protein